MSNKFYAVFKGLKPGIYTSWDECRAQIHGIGGALYKSFLTMKEAEDWIQFMGDERIEHTTIPNIHPEESITGDYAFVDGSYDASNGLYSYGSVICINGELHELSQKSTIDSSLRNIAGEMEAVIATLNYAQQNNVRHITIFHDYTGLAHWPDGTWETKNFATMSYAKAVQDFRLSGMQIDFVHVDGHTGVAGNERADALAKAALGIK